MICTRHSTYFFLPCLIGILFANGETWKEMRHFAHTNLQDMLMVRKVVEEKVMEESQYLIQGVEEHKGTTVFSYAIIIKEVEICHECHFLHRPGNLT